MERRKPSGKPENIDRRIEGDTFPEGCKSKSSLKKFRLKALKKEGSSRHRLRAKYAKNRPRSGFGLTRPTWALTYGLPRAPATNPRAKAPRWREVSSKQTAARGSTDLGSGDPPATTQTASVDPAGPGPIRRPLCYERATHPARSRRERGEIRAKIQKSLGGKMRTALGGPLRL